MKVAQVCLRFDAPGGVETFVRELSVHLHRAGDAVEVFSSDLYDEGNWVRRTDFAPAVDGIPVHRFPVFKRLIPGLTMPLMPGLISGLAAARPDLLHAHSHRYGHLLQAAAVAHRCGIPLVITAHYHPARREERPLKRRLLRGQDFLFGVTAYREADLIVTHTDVERQLVREFAPADRIRVIPSGIDLEPWGRAEGGEASTPLVVGLPRRFVLYTGRVAPNKGLSFLVEAISRIPPEERVPVVVMGRDWGERAALEALARRYGVAQDFSWLGFVPDPAQYRAVFRRATVFVLPSEWEAFGLVLLEAMAARIPIVATAVGGVPEVLEQGRCGRLVPYGEAVPLARAIRELLDAPDEARALSERGTMRVGRFAWETVAGEFRLAYRELAG